jgi:hypothetical protein
MRLFAIFLFLLVFITSCEDDPIVEPQKSKGSSGGSYARLSFPDSTQLK